MVEETSTVILLKELNIKTKDELLEKLATDYIEQRK